MTDIQILLCERVESQVEHLLSAGFIFNSQRYQADIQAQQVTTSTLAAIQSGLPITFPFTWRSGENIMTPFANANDFKAFCGTLMGFVQSVYYLVWTTKDSIKASTTKAEAISIFKNAGFQYYEKE